MWVIGLDIDIVSLVGVLGMVTVMYCIFIFCLFLFRVYFCFSVCSRVVVKVLGFVRVFGVCWGMFVWLSSFFMVMGFMCVIIVLLIVV